MLERIKRFDINDRRIIYISLILLLVALEIFHSFIGLYYDDYGNAALCYGYDANVNGTDWNLSNLTAWAGWIYMNFSGRIMCGSLLNVLINAGNGPRLFYAIQAVIITVLFYCMYRIIMTLVGRKDSIFALVGLVALFFILPDEMYRWTLCWASASVLYIWRMLTFFAIILIQFRLDNDEISENKKRILAVIISIFVVFTAFSHEQTGLSITIYLVLYTIWQRVQKQFKVRNLVFSVLSIIAYAFLFFAPGNWVRMDGNTDFAQLSFLGKIAFQYKPLMECIFRKEFIVIYLCITVFMTYYSWVETRKCKKYLGINLSSIVSLVLILVLYDNLKKNDSRVLVICGTAYLISIFICLIWYNYIKNRPIMTIMLIASAASAFCVLISPSLPIRCFTEWILVISMMLCIMACDWKEYKDYVYLCLVVGDKNIKIRNIIVMIVYIYICMIASQTFIRYNLGYLSNKETLLKNDKILSEYNGEGELYLHKIPNDIYAPAMPYHVGFDYIEYWMKQYYDIPNEVAFHWTIDDYVIYEKTGDFYEDEWFGTQGTIIANNCRASHINLRINIPEEFGDNEFVIKRNGKVKEDEVLSPGINDIQIKLKSYKDNKIEIIAKDGHQLSDEDKRELSCMLSFYFD